MRFRISNCIDHAVEFSVGTEFSVGGAEEFKREYHLAWQRWREWEALHHRQPRHELELHVLCPYNPYSNDDWLNIGWPRGQFITCRHPFSAKQGEDDADTLWIRAQECERGLKEFARFFGWDGRRGELQEFLRESMYGRPKLVQ